MSPSNRKHLLVIGLKSGADPDAGKGPWSAEQVLKAIEQQFELAKQAGFDPENFQVDVTQPHNITLNELRLVVKKKRWDGVSIGYGLRGRQELTPLFEQIVNMIVEEAQPVPKFVFSLRPDSVYEAVARAFGIESTGTE